MAIVRTVEDICLEKARSVINTVIQDYGDDYQYKLLAIVSAKLAGYEYNNIIPFVTVSSNERTQMREAEEMLYNEIISLDISPTLVICSLCRENITYAEKKQKGVYYTDYRLALYLSDLIGKEIQFTSTIVDAASGTGILLMAVAVYCKNKWNKKEFVKWLNSCVYACDISKKALTGIQIAALSLIEANVELNEFFGHLYKIDSLIENFPNGGKFDYVVGNPPWGKIKLTRHMFATEHGIQHTYGEEYKEYDIDKFAESKTVLLRYSAKIREKYPLCERGEIDLYMPFLELAMRIVNKGGKIVFIVPAGLIRSQGTEQLRREILYKYSFTKIAVMDNKDKYFAIDTRFKYLVLCVGNITDESGIYINKPKIINGRICETDGILLTVNELQKIRNDLSIPEIYTEAELKIFRKMIEHGIFCKDESQWKMKISREVDMTAYAKKFKKNSISGIPVIEGRMVQNFRTGAKNYVSGQGRSAIWKINLFGKAMIKPQYTIELDDLPSFTVDRIKTKRAGFCDIAGQTNERAMMASLIPEGVVCGNKVPTITFENDNSDERLLLWIGIVNSFAFDWFLRRILTTTVNFFLLESIPLPAISIGSDVAKRIIDNTRYIIEADANNGSLEDMENRRATIDVDVARAYGLNQEELKCILQDFPLLDRGQPKLNNEKKSTITRDCILMHMGCGANSIDFLKRYKKAKQKGAVAYISSEVQKEMEVLHE